MDYLVVIGTILFSLFSFQYLKYMNRRANEEKSSSEKVHKIPKLYLFTGYLMIVISLGILVVPRLIVNATEYYHPFIWGIIIFIFFFGLYLIQLTRFHRLEQNEDSFLIYSTFNKETEFKYDEIQKIGFNFFTYFISLKDVNNKKAKIYFHMNNILFLLDKIEKESKLDVTLVKNVFKI